MNTIGGISTIPSRENTLELVINSILPQVDLLYVALSGYKHIPEFLEKNRKIVAVVNDNERGDAAKFTLAYVSGVNYFTFDDDLIYPPEYVTYMLKGIKQFGGVVCLHGRIYPRPVVSFKKWIVNYRCLGDVIQDVNVDIGGTGVMAFNTDDLNVSLDDFKHANMADVYFSKLAHEQKVSITVLKHKKDFLKYIPQKKTIWMNMRDVSIQTKISQEFLK